MSCKSGYFISNFHAVNILFDLQRVHICLRVQALVKTHKCCWNKIFIHMITLSTPDIQGRKNDTLMEIRGGIFFVQWHLQWGSEASLWDASICVSPSPRSAPTPKRLSVTAEQQAEVITELHNYSTIVAVVRHGLIDGTFCSYHSGRRVLVHQRLHTEELCDVLGNSSEDAVSARCRHSMALARIPSTNSCDHNWQN